MKTIQKIGTGFLSLFTLLFGFFSYGFPKSKQDNPAKQKMVKVNSGNVDSPENLILQPSSGINNNSNSINGSHKSHASHRSHASGTSGKAGNSGTKAAASPASKPSNFANVASNYSTLLSVADVERITGFSGIQLTSESFFLHFSINNKNVLQVKISAKDYFEYFKGDVSFKTFKGVGDSALITASNMPNQIIFVKGQNCITVTTFMKNETSLYLSIDLLASIGQIIASRI